MKINKLFKSLLITILGISFLFTSTESMSAASAPTQLPAIDHDGDYEFYADAEAEIFRLVNDLRQNPQNYSTTAYGSTQLVSVNNPAVPALSNSSVLTEYARYKSLYMSVYNDFSHEYTEGPLSGVGSTIDGVAADIFFFTNRTWAGENIAARTKNGSATEFGAALFNQWLNSKGHLENMMNANFTEIGIGVVWSDANSMVYATQQFASPASGHTTVGYNNVLPTPYVKEVTNMNITTNPTEVTFEQGDTFATSGKITVTYNDLSTEVLNITKDMCSGYDLTTLGTQTVTITHKDQELTYSIEVKKGTLASIAMKASPSKTNYLINDDLDITGAKLTLTYTNGYTEVIDVSESMVSEFDSSEEGTITITVTYNGETTTFPITVSKENAGTGTGTGNETNSGTITGSGTTAGSNSSTQSASTASSGVNAGDTTNITFMLFLAGFSLLGMYTVSRKKYNK